MTLILNNDDVQSVLTMEVTMNVLSTPILSYPAGSGLPATHRHLHIRHEDEENIDQWVTMKRGSMSRYLRDPNEIGRHLAS